MSFPRYPEYKDSGVEWLGEVPGHWAVTRLKNMAAINMGQSPNSDDCTEEEIGPPFLQGNADFGERCPLPRSYCAVANKLANANDILFSVRAPVGAINVADQSYGIGRGLCAITAKSEHSMRFVFHALQVMKSELFAVATGSTYEAVSTDQVGNAKCLAPSLPEQTQIATFLDRETAKIDALVAEQRRLMALLKEKRQAVISHAVTRGLNPDAPLKPSGIEWLGDVQAHWDVLRLKKLARKLTDGEHISPSLSDSGVPLLSAKDVRDWQVDYDVEKFVTIENAELFWRRCQPEKGDVLVVSRGATVGRVGIVESDTAFCLMGSVILCKPAEGFDPAFLYFALNAKHAQTSLWFSSDSSAQQAIYIRDVADVPVPIPPHAERKEIASFLKAEMFKFDTLTLEAQRAIDLLQERRTALISAAVTGQIDVRGAVQPEVEKAVV
jgi:type I restriction enzyme S subunit